jgi:hypothetical protein
VTAAVVERQSAARRDHQCQTDGDVDQEDRAPTGAEEVRGDQHAPEDLSGDSATGECDGEVAKGLQPLAAVEVQLDAAQHLRDHQRGTRPLDEPRDCEADDLRREAAGQ